MQLPPQLPPPSPLPSHRSQVSPNRSRGRISAGLLLLAALLLILPASGASQWLNPTAMPEFEDRSAERWVNSKPLSRADYKGQVVLIEVWTSI